MVTFQLTTFRKKRFEWFKSVVSRVRVGVVNGMIGSRASAIQELDDGKCGRFSARMPLSTAMKSITFYDFGCFHPKSP
jgi:hypothetical protein